MKKNIVVSAKRRGCPAPRPGSRDRARAGIAPVIEHPRAAFPDGQVGIGRRAYGGIATWAPTPGGGLVREPASRFALLDVTSAIGDASPPLTRQWADTRRGLRALIDAGQLA